MIDAKKFRTDMEDKFRTELIEMLRRGFISKAEMARRIDISMCTLLRVLDEEDVREWSAITRTRVRDFLNRYEKEL